MLTIRKIFTPASLLVITLFGLATCGPAVTSTLETLVSAHHSDVTVMGTITLVLDEILREPTLAFY